MKKVLLITLSIIAIVTLAACGGKTYGGYAYSDFDRIDAWGDIENLGDFYIEMVYVYNQDSLGTSTMATEAANPYVFEFGKTNTLGINLVMANASVLGRNNRPISHYDPALILVHKGEIIDSVTGANPIVEMIEAIENGEYELPNFPVQEYENFNHIEHWSDLAGILESNQLVVVYFYLTTCGACNEIKQDVFSEYYRLRNSQYTLYMVNGATVNGEYPSEVPGSVPALLIYDEGALIITEVGTTSVLDRLALFRP